MASLPERLGRLTASLRGLPRSVDRHEARLRDLEQRVRFLVIENQRLNQRLRELIFHNRLTQGSAVGTQTKDSFDYQWRELPAGEWMPSNRGFLETTPDLIVERTRRPREWWKGKRVLDAGCGSGRWTYGLVQLGAEVTSVDQSAGGLAATRALLGDAKAELIQQDLLDLKLPERSFDFVWCFGVAHHTENMLLAMENVMARVRPGGWLFMMLYGQPVSTDAFACMAEYEELRQTLAPRSFAEKAEYLRGRYPAEQVHGYFDAVSPHINELVAWEWIQAFVSARGFTMPERTVEHPNHHFVAQRRE